MMSMSRAQAQFLTNLYNFTALTSSTNSDGANSTAGLVLAGNTLYGTTQNGGSAGRGTVFAVNRNGTGFTNLHNFLAGTDGANPASSLVLAGGTLYGTTQSGGSATRGTVFKVNTNGTGYAILYNFPAGFTNSAGTAPYAGLVFAGNRIYGTAFGGGSLGYGTVFSLTTNGTSFSTLHNFNGTNGGNPSAGLILAGNQLYGTAYQGGFTNGGTVFTVRTNGTGFTNLYDFSRTNGANPYAGLFLSGDTLYGATRYGGSANSGTLFAIKTNGINFTNLHIFDGVDGANPNASLIVSGTRLLGTAYRGGDAGKGTVFSIDVNSGGFTNIYNFSTTAPEPPFNNNDGANPVCHLVLSSNTVYGTASGGGASGNGTVFSLSLPPVRPLLSIRRAGTNVVLAWPTNTAGFALQSTTNLAGPIVWGTVAPPPVILNGNNTVTNPIAGAQKYYRLSQ